MFRVQVIVDRRGVLWVLWTAPEKECAAAPQQHAESRAEPIPLPLPPRVANITALIVPELQ